MPPFGRRPNDPAVDMSRLTAVASPEEAIPFATMDFSEILVPHDYGQIQLRHINKGQKVLGLVNLGNHSSFEMLRNAVFDAFKEQGEPNTTARFLTHEGLRLKVISVETTTGELYICRQLRQIPEFSSIQGIANPIRAHLSMLGHTQQSGLVIVSGPPCSGKTTTILAIILHLTKISEDVTLVVGSLPELRLNGIVQGSQGRIVQIRAVTDPAFYDDHLRSLLTLSPRFAAVGSISSSLEARLALDLAMAGILVVTTINSNDIPSAIGNFINRASSSFGAVTARDAVALTLRGVMHQTLGDRDSSADLNMRRLNITSLFLPGPSGNQTMMRKIKDDRIQDFGPDITFQNARVRNNQAPLEDSELIRYDILRNENLSEVTQGVRADR